MDSRLPWVRRVLSSFLSCFLLRHMAKEISYNENIDDMLIVMDHMSVDEVLVYAQNENSNDKSKLFFIPFFS